MKALALSTAAALALSAVCAAVAQAEAERGAWHRNGAALPFGQGEALTTSINSAELLLRWPGLLTFRGTGVASTEAAIRGTGEGGATTITFTGVTVVGAGACEVHSREAPKGPLVWHAVTTYLVKEGEAYKEILTPSAGTNHAFFTVVVAGCSLSGTYEYTRSLVGKVLSPTTEAETHVLEFRSPRLTTTCEGVEFGNLYLGATHTAKLEVKINETVAKSGHKNSAT